MNSLTYIARQFDVLASPRAPPSTPTGERTAFLSDRRSRLDEDADPSLKRVRTWSTKSFLFPPPSPSASSSPPPKRSYSSPPGSFHVIDAARRPSISATSDSSTRPKWSIGNALRRICIVRVFVYLWCAIHTAWTSFTRWDLWQSSHRNKPPAAAAVESAAEDQEKDTATETEDEKPVSQHELEQPLRPPIPPPPSGLSFPFPKFGRSRSDSVLTSDSQEESPSHASTSSHPGGTLPSLPNLADASSRSSTPAMVSSRKTAFHVPKTLVLDLDETLIHSTSRPIYSSGSGGTGLLGLGEFGRRNKGTGHVVEVVLGGRSTLYHVYKRPFVDYFLRKVSGWYTLVIFTASMQEYADPVIDWLDAGRGILARRLFRESCTQLPNGSYTKDLSIIEEDLSRVCLIDNSPISYRINEANGIPIEGWTHDPSDEALLALLPVLDSLRFTSDVRRVLGIRGFS
ncbi:hypothetical protein PLICRDRAFT_192906 [Plicaturopsis crispa FD-325 SS-3]|nr:hypothetical protein PLICRDRAFT_192906 [Plicaturopsis crispa FD-325 SS-3]